MLRLEQVPLAVRPFLIVLLIPFLQLLLDTLNLVAQFVPVSLLDVLVLVLFDLVGEVALVSGDGLPVVSDLQFCNGPAVL